MEKKEEVKSETVPTSNYVRKWNQKQSPHLIMYNRRNRYNFGWKMEGGLILIHTLKLIIYTFLFLFS